MSDAGSVASSFRANPLYVARRESAKRDYEGSEYSAYKGAGKNNLNGTGKGNDGEEESSVDDHDASTIATGQQSMSPTALTDQQQQKQPRYSFFNSHPKARIMVSDNNEEEMFDFANIYDNESVSDQGEASSSTSRGNAKILSGREKQMKMMENYQRVQMLSQRSAAITSPKQALHHVTTGSDAVTGTETGVAASKKNNAKDASKDTGIKDTNAAGTSTSKKAAKAVSTSIRKSVSQTAQTALKSLRHVKRTMNSRIRTDDEGPGAKEDFDTSSVADDTDDAKSLVSDISSLENESIMGSVTPSVAAFHGSNHPVDEALAAINGINFNSINLHRCISQSRPDIPKHKTSNKYNSPSVAVGHTTSTDPHAVHYSAPLFVDTEGPTPIFAPIKFNLN